MTKEELPKKLTEKIKAGIKHFRFNSSLTSPNSEVPNANKQVNYIAELEKNNSDLLKANQETVQQNKKLVEVIKQLREEKNLWEEKFLEKRLELLKTPLVNPSVTNSLKKQLLFYQNQTKRKNLLIIFLSALFASVLLLK